MKNLKSIIVDDDEITRERMTSILGGLGVATEALGSAERAFELITKSKPDIVFLDILMPNLDGLELCRQIRANRQLDSCVVVILSSKSFSYDRRRAMELGANYFLNKPEQKDHIKKIIDQFFGPAMKVNFWGVRGTMPVSGLSSNQYGGNTSCVSLELSSGELFVFDAGTGIRELGNAIMSGRFNQKELSLMISHPHWDHVNSIPFFAPLYSKNYKCDVYGPVNQGVSVKKMVSDQMSGVYFPITLQDFSAQLSFHDLVEQQFSLGGAQVSTMLLNHPGNCLGYKLAYRDRTFAYVTDNEIFDKTSPHFQLAQYEKLKSFVSDVDVLVTDSTYLNNEYPSKIGWGHSSVGQVVVLAHEARVKQLCLFHHDPDQRDSAINEKLKWAQEKLIELKSSTICVAPAEGQLIEVAQNGKVTLGDFGTNPSGQKVG